MGMTKYASLGESQVLEVKGAASRQRTASLDKLSDYHDYRHDDGYMYARIIAISSRVNKNNDGWPSVELVGGEDAWTQITGTKERTASIGPITAEARSDYSHGYSTFVGKPIFVDHNNSDPKRARGVIVDAKVHIDDTKTASEHNEYYSSSTVDTEHLPPTRVELLLEVDAKAFPKLAKAIRDGDIDGFSMGCDVERSKCSHCGNEASSPQEYCSHIVSKGGLHDFETTSSDGTKRRESRRSYENCYGIKFFEISAVFDPADETALLQELVDEPNTRQGSYLQQKIAEGPLPQFMHTKSPEQVDTLREEQICPVCGETMEGEKCDVCGHVKEPEGFDNPDLSQAQNNPELSQEMGQELDEAPNSAQNNLLEEKPDPGTSTAVSYLQGRNRPNPGPVTSAKINVVENPIKDTTRPATNEPKETVISDQTRPVTSTFRTAMDLIQAAKQSKQTEDNMADRNRVAAEPADPSGKPDKRVDVNGIGGVADATNEKASKPENKRGEPGSGTTVDVEGKGGIMQDTNTEASKPDKIDDVERVGDKQTSGPTKTFPNTNEPDSAVSDKAMTAAVEAAKQGVKPIGGSDVQPQRRENVEQESGFNNPQKGTDQWTGTGGNGVTRQADPVTRKVDPNIDVKSSSFSHIVAAMKLADTEVELGLTEKDKKYDRVAELEALTPGELAAEERVVARVRTAGFQKAASTRRQAATREGEVAGRMPSFSRTAGATEPKETTKVTDQDTDSALFMR